MKPLLVAAAALALALPACSKTDQASPAGSAAAALPSTVVVTYASGKQVTLAEVDNSVAKELYQLRRQAVETMVLRNLVLADAAKAGKNEDDFLQAKAAELVQAPTDEEIKQVYEANKEAFGERSFDDVKPMIVSRMRQEKEKESLIAYFDSLKKGAGVKITLPEPRVAVAATGPSKGPDGAPITIVEFSDFQCPYCAQARKTADQAVTAFAGKVRLVFRPFPLSFHDKAQKAAEAGLCAHEQGKFWELHDWMFEHQDKLEPASLKESAKTLGLDAARFDGCLDSGKMADKVKDDMKAGQEAGVTGTPAFFINGRMIGGNQPFEKFKELIEEDLAR
jgi:protein-disulfide isomerase